MNTSENNKPVGVWQTSIGIMDKVKNGNSPFKAGIKLENADTGESTLKEVSNDNIDFSESKKFGNFFEEIKYSFKTDGLEPGTYKYRTYITYHDGTTEFSQNSETITIMDQDTQYFEIYCESEGTVTLINQIDEDFMISEILCDGKATKFQKDKFYPMYYLHTPTGFHRYKIFYNGSPVMSLRFDNTQLCGGYFPYTTNELDFSNFEKENIKVQEISTTTQGDYILTLPHIKSISGLHNCSSITSIDLSECKDLTRINYSAFRNCSSLSKIDLSGCSGLTTIGDHAFEDCLSLSSINISGCSKLTEIESYAFSNCSSLSSINLSGCSELIKIGGYAFEDCSSLSSIDLNICSKLTEIGCSAFENCNLSNITIPPSVKTIDSDSFSCESLKTIYCYPIIPPVDDFRYPLLGWSFLSNRGHVFREIPDGKFPNIYVPSQSLKEYQDKWGLHVYIIDPDGEYIEIYNYKGEAVRIDYFEKYKDLISRKTENGTYERDPKGEYVRYGNVYYLYKRLSIECFNIFPM